MRWMITCGRMNGKSRLLDQLAAYGVALERLAAYEGLSARQDDITYTIRLQDW